MKFRFSFLNYIISMTGFSSAFTFATAIILSITIGFLGLGGAMLITISPMIVGLISGFIASSLISFIASNFFHPEDIFDLKFQIISYCIVAIITLITVYLVRNAFVNERNILFIELGVVSLLVLVMIYAQYFSSRFLVTPIEKRKEK